MMRVAVPGFVLLALTVASPALAYDPRYPDWPCQQIKVPELSVAAIWAGPPVDNVGDSWRQDQEISDLVARTVARRTPLPDAEKAVTDFLAAVPASAREQKAKLLFAGLFATENGDRSSIMDGIERYARHQQDYAQKIRTEVQQMHDLQGSANPDQAKIDELGNTLNWDTRIFEERRKTIGYVCDVPTQIEQRLGALARAIQQAME